MATNKLPELSKEQIAKANAFAKKNDPNAEQDIIFCDEQSGGFGLYFIRARNKDKQVLGTEVRWMPLVQSGTINDFLTYLAAHYNGGTIESAELILKQRVLQAEMVTLRSAMKRVRSAGVRKGAFNR